MIEQTKQTMIRIEEKDNCPDYVYKYCSRNVFETHIKKGSFKLGALADYRDAYENKGAEYGDGVEGNPSLFKKGPCDFGGQTVESDGGIVIDLLTNAFIFSAALTYSVIDHERWFLRKGCGYDICLKIKGKRFFKSLAFELSNKGYKGAKFFIAKPIYNNGSANLSGDNQYLVDHFLVKNDQLIWENEYRFICAIPKLSVNSKQPIFVNSIEALSCIESYTKFKQ